MEAQVEEKAKATPLTSVDENTLSFSINDIKHASETPTSTSSIFTPTVSITNTTETPHVDSSEIAISNNNNSNENDKDNTEIRTEHSHFSINPTLEHMSEKNEESPTVASTIVESDNVFQWQHYVLRLIRHGITIGVETMRGLYLPDEVTFYVDAVIRLMFCVYYLPIIALIIAITHSELERIVWVLVIPVKQEMERNPYNFSQWWMLCMGLWQITLKVAPFTVLGLSMATIGHKAINCVSEAMVDAYTTQHGFDYPLSHARLQFILCSRVRCTVFICVVSLLLCGVSWIIHIDALRLTPLNVPIILIMLVMIVIVQIVFMCYTAVRGAPNVVKDNVLQNLSLSKSARNTSAIKSKTEQTPREESTHQSNENRAENRRSINNNNNNDNNISMNIENRENKSESFSIQKAEKENDQNVNSSTHTTEYENIIANASSISASLPSLPTITLKLDSSLNDNHNSTSTLQESSTKNNDEHGKTSSKKREVVAATQEKSINAGNSKKSESSRLTAVATQTEATHDSLLLNHDNKKQKIEEVLESRSIGKTGNDSLSTTGEILVRYLGEEWWRRRMKVIRHTSFGLVICGAAALTIWAGPYYGISTAILLIFHLNLPHVLTYTSLSIAFAVIRVGRSLRWLHRHYDALPVVGIILLPYQLLLLNAMWCFRRHEVMELMLFVINVMLFARAIDLVREFDVSALGSVHWRDKHTTSNTLIAPSLAILLENGYELKQKWMDMVSLDFSVDLQAMRIIHHHHTHHYISSSNNNTNSNKEEGEGDSKNEKSNTSIHSKRDNNSINNYTSEEDKEETTHLEINNKSNNNNNNASNNVVVNANVHYQYNTITELERTQIVPYGQSYRYLKSSAFYLYTLPRLLSLQSPVNFSGARFRRARIALRMLSITMLLIYGCIVCGVIVQAAFPHLRPLPVRVRASFNHSYLRFDHIVVNMNLISQNYSEYYRNYINKNKETLEYTSMCSLSELMEKPECMSALYKSLEEEELYEEKQEQEQEQEVLHKPSLNDYQERENALATKEYLLQSSHASRDNTSTASNNNNSNARIDNTNTPKVKSEKVNSNVHVKHDKMYWHRAKEKLKSLRPAIETFKWHNITSGKDEDFYPHLCTRDYHGISIWELSLLALAPYLFNIHEINTMLQFMNMQLESDWVIRPRHGTECVRGDSSHQPTQWNGFYDIYSAKYDTSVIAIRGTDLFSFSDFLIDVNLFFETFIYRLATTVIPGAVIMPKDIVVDLIRTAALPPLIVDEQGKMKTTPSPSLYETWEALLHSTNTSRRECMHNNYGRDFFVDVYNHLAYIALQHNRNNNNNSNSSNKSTDTSLNESTSETTPHHVILTGHSLGGTVAAIVGAQMELDAVVFNSPGILLLHKKFNLDTRAIHKHVLTVVSSNDIVPAFGEYGGEVQHIECFGATRELCHAMEYLIGSLWRSCGSIRARFANIKDVNERNVIPKFLIS